MQRPHSFRAAAVVLVAGLAAVAAEGVPPARGLQLGARQGQEPPRPTSAADGLLPVDETMFEVAAATGGDFYFWSPGEFARSDLRLPAAGESVLVAHGVLGAEPETFDFPVDGLTGRIELFVGAQRLESVRVSDPAGAYFGTGLPGVELQAFDRMRLLSIERPEAGEWRLELRGAGRYSVSVRVPRHSAPPLGDPDLEPIEVLGFDLVELRGRPGHRGLFPLRRDPAPGERHPFELQLSGSFRTARVLFVTPGGVTFDAFEVQADEEDADSSWRTLRGSCTIPEAPFRVAVEGLDATGRTYRRCCDGLVVPGRAATAAELDGRRAYEELDGR